MTKISLQNLGKRFNREWLFDQISMDLDSEKAYAVLGGNGSGKSTFLKVVSGFSMPSSGEIIYAVAGQDLKQADVYRHVGFCSPYLDLYDELNLSEMVRFHFSLKPHLSQFDLNEFGKTCQLEHAMTKPIKYFSSGMKQRVRLGLALLSDCPFIFLDEPTSNLDHRGIDWYQEMVDKTKQGRIYIVASNQVEEEYGFCSEKIWIENFKRA